MEQEIGAAAGLSHLLGFGHAAVDQEVGRTFGQRGADPQTGTMAFGIVDQPSALAGEITVMDAAPNGFGEEQDDEQGIDQRDVFSGALAKTA